MGSSLRGVPLLAILFIAGTVGAHTFVVTSTMDQPDSSPGDGVCSSTPGVACTLRAAVEEANALAGDDRINLPAGTFTLTITGAGEDAAATGDLDVSGNVSIYGVSADTTTIDAAGIDRVFDLRSGVLELVGLTVRGGRATSATSFQGGGIRAEGSLLSVGGCRLTDNAANQGGAIFGSSTTTVQVADSVFDGNATQNLGYVNEWGVAILAQGGLSLESSTVTANTSGLGSPFAVHAKCSSGTVLILNSTVAANTASGIYTYNCDATLFNVTVVDNTMYGVTMGSYDNTDNLVVRNSIIAGNDIDCNLSASTTVTFDHTLDGDDSCGLLAANGDLPMTDPMLLPLKDWGGVTTTAYPRPGSSPVIDAGSSDFCYLTDQRGEVRGGDGNGDGIPGCDIGAVEATNLVFFDQFEDGSTGWWSGGAGLTP